MALKTLFFLAVGASSALGQSDDSGSLTMSVGTNGTTVQAVSGTTEFMGTEYNPDKCVLQFLSLECDDDDCAQLNGYELECVSQGKQNGKEKKLCQCKSEDANSCQNSANPNATSGTVPQFGECSDQNQCVDSYGYIATSTEEGPICAEKLHCVQEVNTTATEPASICHTCMSCIAQNDAADKQLAGVKRFNCSSICPRRSSTLWPSATPLVWALPTRTRSRPRRLVRTTRTQPHRRRRPAAAVLRAPAAPRRSPRRTWLPSSRPSLVWHFWVL
ncbi:hypothetical protein GQ600_5478 [Phytophthora cactorum]|nr:hypothetical protein GQ600_5478 [Phytophthora cactorum]